MQEDPQARGGELPAADAVMTKEHTPKAADSAQYDFRQASMGLGAIAAAFGGLAIAAIVLLATKDPGASHEPLRASAAAAFSVSLFASVVAAVALNGVGADRDTERVAALSVYARGCLVVGLVSGFWGVGLIAGAAFSGPAVPTTRWMCFAVDILMPTFMTFASRDQLVRSASSNTSKHAELLSGLRIYIPAWCLIVVAVAVRLRHGSFLVPPAAQPTLQTAALILGGAIVLTGACAGTTLQRSIWMRLARPGLVGLWILFVTAFIALTILLLPAVDVSAPT